MPEQDTIERAEQDRREGKAPSTQAGEFVREEIHHVREGEHGARSTKQAVAIGLSKARRAGVKLRPPKKGAADPRPARLTRSRRTADFHSKEETMKARQLMTPDPCCCATDASVTEVARIMRDNDCGSVPVVDGAGYIVGIVTDRDLAVRGLAEGRSGDARAADLMTPAPHCCSPDDSIDHVEEMMASNQVRRVPIVEASGRCVGIIAQADLARAAVQGRRVTEHGVAIVVERISEPPNVPIDRGPGGARSQLDQRL